LLNLEYGQAEVYIAGMDRHAPCSTAATDLCAAAPRLDMNVRAHFETLLVEVPHFLLLNCFERRSSDVP